MPQNDAIDFFKMSTHKMDKNKYIPANSRPLNINVEQSDRNGSAKSGAKSNMKDFK